ncbi:cytochrome c oxidase cbb3-type accessory protein CcoH [Caenibius tardaugens NBRC 16725]|uniref:Cytochrome c oxidase cbb3-type accessory protein CcoH n=1 Tax=Caenibius tardaugens NBRC 16725 TaxID=1219035 RepID=U3A526_9SPHN|nr:FixH family protein [Caenibius tardaugens]GAD49833.1 cytochrome c oxidase cbb3-type accessory protein CcoH [Caenibius tardaugens NBRC 16725]
MSTRFTGRHMAIILILFFGTIIAVNVLMARLASSTFGGIVVENSYVASQEFNTWLDKAEAQQALGWEASTKRTPDDHVAITLKGAPSTASVSAIARHPLGHAPNRPLTFTGDGNGNWVSHEKLPQGRWLLRITAQADGHTWRVEENVP